MILLREHLNISLLQDRPHTFDISKRPGTRPGVVRLMVTSAITGASLLGQRHGCEAEANFYLFPIIAFIALYLTITSTLYKFYSTVSLHICNVYTYLYWLFIQNMNVSYSVALSRRLSKENSSSVKTLRCKNLVLDIAPFAPFAFFATRLWQRTGVHKKNRIVERLDIFFSVITDFISSSSHGIL